MRPHIICHMLSSLDGRIDGAVLANVMNRGEYEATGALLKGDAWVCGRTTMEQHFAEPGPFVPASRAPAGPQPVFVARRAASYAVAVDTHGKLRWASGDLAGDHLICVVSEEVSADYLATLREKQISYIVSGRSSVDLVDAVGKLGDAFGIRTLLLEGGGHINGAFLEAGLVDEVSLLLAPGIDGRRGMATVFDGVGAAKQQATRLKLQSLERRENDTLWLRYDVERDSENQARS